MKIEMRRLSKNTNDELFAQQFIRLHLVSSAATIALVRYMDL